MDAHPSLSRHSSLFYAWRVARPAARGGLLALYGICRSVWDVTRQVSDPGVAASKLAWWRGELGAMARGAAQHPLTKALWQACEADVERLNMPALLTFIDGCELDLMQTRLLDEAALLSHARAVGAAPWQAAFQLGRSGTQAASSSMEDQAALELGTGLRLVDIVLSLGAETRTGRVYLPLTDLQGFAVRSADLLHSASGLQTEPRFQSLMQHQAERARRQLVLAEQSARTLVRSQAKPIRVLLALARTQLDEVEDTGFATLTQRVLLTPVRKAWIAWRA